MCSAALAALTVLLMAGCAHTATTDLQPHTVGNLDLKRYQGTWYEIARLPMFFQRNCAQSEAHYSLKADGNVGVVNRCRTASGEWEEATGTASPQVPGKTDKLWVVFDNWFSKLLPGVAK
ncbi:lipocalin, partial [Pseudomonas syringae]